MKPQIYLFLCGIFRETVSLMRIANTIGGCRVILDSSDISGVGYNNDIKVIKIFF